MSARWPFAIVLSLLWFSHGCRNEAFERNRERLIEKTQIRGVGADVSREALQRTKESFVDLTIGINTYCHERAFGTLAELTNYLNDVIFNGEIPREFFKGQNRIVERFDGGGGWVVTFSSDGKSFRLDINVGDDRGRPLQVLLVEK